MKKTYIINCETYYGYGTDERYTIAYVRDTLENVQQVVSDLNDNYGFEEDEKYKLYTFAEMKCITLEELTEVYRIK